MKNTRISSENFPFLVVYLNERVFEWFLHGRMCCGYSLEASH